MPQRATKKENVVPIKSGPVKAETAAVSRANDRIEISYFDNGEFTEVSLPSHIFEQTAPLTTENTPALSNLAPEELISRSTPKTNSIAPPIDRALSFADLKDAGEGTRWTILRRIERGDFPEPDFYIGRFPRWLGSTVKARRAALILEAQQPLDAPK